MIARLWFSRVGVSCAAVLAVVAAPAAGYGSATDGAARHPAHVTSHATWSVRATTQRQPFAHPEGPVTATPHPLTRGCTNVRSPRHPVIGEGILDLTVKPTTIWSSDSTTSVTLDVSVDKSPAQQVVLFYGESAFRYESFLGRFATGTHCVHVAVDADRSHDSAPPAMDVYGVALHVVPKDSSAYQLMTHAPVVYGRASSSERNAQLLTYGQSTADANGRDLDLSYTVIWAREDVGDGIVPAYEWGLWGRMTDIETVLKERVSPSGKIRSAEYLSCGCEKFPTYPDEAVAPPVTSEVDSTYPSAGVPAPLGRHLVLRDATGNNDMSPSGTSAFRMQQLPVLGPADGQSREVAMDSHPWTYRISNDEVQRSTVTSSDAKSLLAGGYPQYLIVDIDAAASGTSSISVEVQLSGDPTWYSNDYAQTTAPGPPSTYPFYNGGHARTVIKLPQGWTDHRISALRLRLNQQPGGSMPALTGTPAISLIGLTAGYRIVHPVVPTPSVIIGTQLMPGLPS